MSDGQRRPEQILAAHADLGWCYTGSHNLDHVVGVAREQEAEERRLNGSTFGQGGSGSGHADPTAGAALDTTATDSVKVTAAIDAQLREACNAAAALDRETSIVLGRGPVAPTHRMESRCHLLQVASSRLIRAKDALLEVEPLAIAQGSTGWLAEIDVQIRTVLEAAAWLRNRSELILGRGPEREPAVQKPLNACRIHARHYDRDVPLATKQGLCDQCHEFRHRHRCEPTGPILKRWEYGNAATPGQIAEAKASVAKRGRKAS